MLLDCGVQALCGGVGAILTQVGLGAPVRDVVGQFGIARALSTIEGAGGVGGLVDVEQRQAQLELHSGGLVLIEVVG
jgi:hypothetical protein